MPDYTATRARRYRNTPQRDRLAELEQWLQEDESHRTAYTYLYAQVMERTDDRPAPQFFVDLLTKARRYGNLTPNQLAAVLRSIERDAERAVEREAERIALKDVAPLAVGRRVVQGEIVSCRWRHSRYGGAFKIVVREADGNKVWGTLPGNLEAELGGSPEETARGRFVRLVAQVDRSDEDEHFGFYKRPANAEFLTADPAQPVATVRLP